MTDSSPKISLTKEFPKYSLLRIFIRIMDTESLATFYGMRRSVWAKAGSSDKPSDWTNPLAWIPQILSDAEAALAGKIWQQSNAMINPRHLDGYWAVCHRYAYLLADANQVLSVSSLGTVFLDPNQASPTLWMDLHEGMLIILNLLNDLSPAPVSGLLPGFSQFCSQRTTIQSQNSQQDALRDRLMNLTDRALADYNAGQFSITKTGKAYLAEYQGLVP